MHSHVRAGDIMFPRSFSFFLIFAKYYFISGSLYSADVTGTFRMRLILENVCVAGVIYSGGV